MAVKFIQGQLSLSWLWNGEIKLSWSTLLSQHLAKISSRKILPSSTIWWLGVYQMKLGFLYTGSLPLLKSYARLRLLSLNQEHNVTLFNGSGGNMTAGTEFSPWCRQDWSRYHCSTYYRTTGKKFGKSEGNRRWSTPESDFSITEMYHPGWMFADADAVRFFESVTWRSKTSVNSLKLLHTRTLTRKSYREVATSTAVCRRSP